jgi:hypothetical protein
MKTLGMIVGIVLSVATVGQAHAEMECNLSISQTSVPVGTPFFFTVSVDWLVDPEPGIPGQRPPRGPFNAFFLGDKDGVPDIAQPSFQVPETPGYGTTNLVGYVNPGNVTGTYTRYLVLKDPQGRAVCVTNAVAAFLQ